MRTFVIAILLSALFIGIHAEFAGKQQVDAVVDMGLIYAQNALSIDEQCITVLKKGYDLATKVIDAISKGETNDLFSLMMSAINIVNDFKAHCLNQ